MIPDIFEVAMLLCFGAAWPFSIYKMIKTKRSDGKSVPFLIILLMGYMAGIAFVFFGERNYVLFFICLISLWLAGIWF